MPRKYSTDRKAERARFRRALRGSKWQYVEFRRGLYWSLVLSDGRRTPWLGEWLLPDGAELWSPEGLFYRYFAAQVCIIIGIDANATVAKSLAPLVLRAKIPLPDAPLMRIVRKAS